MSIKTRRTGKMMVGSLLGLSLLAVFGFLWTGAGAQSADGTGKAAVEELIYDGDITGAKAAIQQWITASASDAGLPGDLYRIAREFSRQGYPQEGAEVCNLITAQFSSSSVAAKAQVRAAEYDIRAQIREGDYAAAEAAMIQMRTDYASNADLPEIVNDLAAKLLYEGQAEQAATILADVRDNYPTGKGRNQVLMNLALAQVILKQENAVRQSLGQLMQEQAENGKGIANAVFCTANQYRLLGRYEQQRRILKWAANQWISAEPTFYQQWVSVYSKAAGITKKEVLESEIRKLIENYPSEERTSRFFYWLGNLLHQAGDTANACAVYQVAVDRWPAEEWSLSSRLAKILIDPSLEEATRQAALDTYVQNFSGHKHFGAAVVRVACDLYGGGLQKQKEASVDDARTDFARVLECCTLADEAVRMPLYARQDQQILKAYCLNHLGQTESAVGVLESLLGDSRTMGETARKAVGILNRIYKQLGREETAQAVYDASHPANNG